MKLMEFKEGGRTFTCRAESSPATPKMVWWWMSVSGESQRYAAFPVDASDTAPQLKARILAFYEQLLVVRARPVEVRSHWAKRGAAKTAAVEAPADSDLPLIAE
jgi:hypothetical protein